MAALRYRFLSTLIWLLVGPILLFPNAAPWLAGVAVLLLVGLRLLAGRYAPQETGFRTWQRTFLDGFILVYIILALVAYAASPLPAHSLPKLTALLWGMAGFYLAQDWLNGRKAIDRLMIMLAFAAVGLAVVSLFTVAWPVQSQIIDLTFFYRLLPGWELVHRNEAAIMLCLLLPFLAIWIIQGKGYRRWMAVLGIGLVLLVILLTQSRAALISLAGMTAAYMLWGRFHVRIVLGVGLAALLVVLAVAFWPGVTGDLAEAVTQVDQATRPGAVVSWAVRIDLWQAAGRILQEYPVLGAGLFAYYDVARLHYVFNYAGFSTDLAHAHNLFLQSGADMGWPGFFLLLFFWGCVVFFLWRMARPAVAPGWGPYARLWGVSITGYLLFNMVDVVGLGHRPGFLIWLVLAGAAALVRLAQQEARVLFPAPQRVLVWFPVGVFLLLAPFWLNQNLANIRLDRVLLTDGELVDLTIGQFAGDARRSGWMAFITGNDDAARSHWEMLPQGGDYLAGRGFVAHRENQLDEALRLYNLSLALSPQNAQVHYWRGLILQEKEEFAQAEAEFSTAAGLISAEEEPSWAAALQYQWSRVLAAQGEWPAARQHVEMAIEDQPGQGDYYRLLGEILEATGDPAGAEAAFERAEQLP